MKEIYSFHKENPELLIGLMSFPDSSLSTFILIQYFFFPSPINFNSYFLRALHVSIDSVNSQYHLVDRIEFYCF